MISRFRARVALTRVMKKTTSSTNSRSTYARGDDRGRDWKISAVARRCTKCEGDSDDRPQTSQFAGRSAAARAPKQTSTPMSSNRSIDRGTRS